MQVLINAPVLESMRISRDRVALEASVSSAVSQLLQHAWPSFNQGIKEFFGLVPTDHKPVDLTREQRTFMQYLEKHTYLDVAPIGAFVPEGLKVPYLTYIHALAPSVAHVKTALREVTATYSQFLSELLSNPEAKLNTSSKVNYYRSWETEREQLNKTLANNFTQGSHETRTSMGEVVQRNGDWTRVFHEVDALAADINSISRQELNKTLASINELVDVVDKKIKRGELEGISRQAMEHLAEGAYGVAREIEFYVAIFYKVEALSQAVNQTTHKFVEIQERR